ncbi:PaaD family metal-sulfur cluster biosynthetic protein [Acidilobus sp. SCGC AC-742_M05]|nr:PaaD family metal-sulfur cluster biosynthetic protein [Acidilobus sp. SCGC AC-742_M05]PVU68386.1 PaaD family metal-sulfur cluster biosynthetic protein [Acidilobus sp. SCGC AC-742_M05]PVU73151.1 PaaD family metal-sulfur cluster biosynthetic protein [Acidilobus sp. SCGC AC-742_E15]
MSRLSTAKRPPFLKVSGDEDLIRLAEEALREVYDPEIPVNVYDLGLIYAIDARRVNGKPKVAILMTLTAIGCPVTGSILAYVEQALLDKIAGLSEENLEIEVTFDPPWSPDMVSEVGREALKELYGYDVVEEWKKRMSEQYQETSSEGQAQGS